MQHGQKRIADGFVSLEGGMDSGRNSSIIERNKVAYSSNVRFRGGFPTCRPGFTKLSQIFRKNSTLPYEAVDSLAQSAFQNSLFQGACYYGHENGTGVIFALVGGKIFQLDVEESISRVVNNPYVTGYKVREVSITNNIETLVLTPGFTVPVTGGTVSVPVASSANMSTDLPQIIINGLPYTLVSVDTSTSITVQNYAVASGTVVAAGVSVKFDVKDVNSSAVPKVYFCRAEQFLIIQDGQSKAIIFDGSKFRRAGTNEVPTGTVMAYGNGRLWVAINGGKHFVAGDIVGGPSGTGQYNYSDALLRFTENTYLNEGGYFRVPAYAGPITAMAFIATPDTSLGQGPLQVFTSTHVVSVDAPVDRDQWKNLQSPIQTISLISNGSLSDKATVLVNGDIFYRSKDGIRSFAVARRELGTWGNTPISNEMQAVLGNDSQSLLNASSCVLFDNRLLMTAEPVLEGINPSSAVSVDGVSFTPDQNSVTLFKKVVALDFHPISAMGVRSAPAYDGVWDTGSISVNFLQLLTGIVNGEEKCWFIGLNSDGKNELWEISKNNRFDYNGDQTEVRIASYIETKSMDFPFGITTQGSDAMQLKRLEMAEMFVDDLFGSVSFTVKYRPDQAPDWYSWHSWSESVTHKDCSTPQCTYGTNASLTCRSPNYRARMRLPVPSDACETGQTKLSRFGYEFQARIEWTGSARIKKFRAQAQETQEENYGDCR